MIERVHVQNFKSLWDVTLELGRFTILVGPNGCGKSSLLQAMAMAEQENTIRRRWQPTNPNLPAFVRLFADDGTSFEFEGNPGSSSSRPSDPKLRKRFRAALLHPQADKFAKPSLAFAGDRPELKQDGEGLASMLAYIAGYNPQAFLAISQDLAAVVPGVKHVRVTPVQISPWESADDASRAHMGKEAHRGVPGHKFWIEFMDGRQLPSELVSEGTSVALGILTLIHAPDRPHLLLIDDVDRGLHIEAQAKLVEILRSILELDPELQIVCTTHSPYLVSLCEPEEVWVLALDAERHTRALPLTAHPDFDKWRFGSQTGELWAALGHAWVAKEAASHP